MSENSEVEKVWSNWWASSLTISQLKWKKKRLGDTPVSKKSKRPFLQPCL